MALLIIPVLKRWSRARGPYGYLRTWNWPITASEISQPHNKVLYSVYWIVLYCIVLYWVVLYYIVLYCVVWNCLWIFFSSRGLTTRGLKGSRHFQRLPSVNCLLAYKLRYSLLAKMRLCTEERTVFHWVVLFLCLTSTQSHLANCSPWSW